MPHCLRRAGATSMVAIAIAISLFVGPARAADRPFLLTSSAAAEEDDDNVWAIESWWQRAGSQRTFSIAPEYAFSPTDSVQFEFSRSRDRAAGDRSHGLEVEFKHLFNRIGRDGFGWGLDLSLAAGSANGSGWHAEGLALKLPWTLAIGESGAQLHANAGIAKARGARREFVASAAYEHPLPGRVTGFVEIGRADRQTLLHGGIRHWLKREKLALDISVQRIRAGSDSASGVVIGIGWYDL
ncbi:MAG: hypothetical protein ABIO45_05130 [Burkholderiaceae bacterium]